MKKKMVANMSLAWSVGSGLGVDDGTAAADWCNQEQKAS
jgi:hypothetical protein